MAEIQWTGTLEDHSEVNSEVNSEVAPGGPVAAARDAFAVAEPDGMVPALEAVVAAVRTGPVLVDLSTTGGQSWEVTAISQQSTQWVPVFSSVSELGLWRQLCERGDERVHYAEVTGTELVDLLPATESVGLLLDPGSQSPLTLPVHRLTDESEQR